MPEEYMNLSINGQSQVPPGFRFHPTEEELLHYYLRKKVGFERIDLDVIREVDLNKLEPWDIQEKCKIGSTPQNDWYFFSHKDKKYPTGTRTNRATAAGFWKATGRDKIIYSGFKRIGLRKTLVFYKGRAPHGQKSDWIMHEYRLEDGTCTSLDTIPAGASNPMAEAVPEEGWVVCRVFRKKNYQKTLESPKSSSVSMDSKTQILDSGNDGVLDQILLYMGRSCKMEENEPFNNFISNTTGVAAASAAATSVRFLSAAANSNGSIAQALHERFIHLPRLDSPSFDQDPPSLKSHRSYDDVITENDTSAGAAAVSDWVALDRLVASQLNGQVMTISKSCSFSDVVVPSFGGGDLCHEDDDRDVELSDEFDCRRSNHLIDSHHVYGEVNDLWSFTKTSSSPSSSSDPLCHLSV